MSKNIVITFDELMSELDKHRGKNIKRLSLTPPQKKFLVAAREGGEPVPYARMAELWERAGWGKIEQESIRKYYLKVKDGVL